MAIVVRQPFTYFLNCHSYSKCKMLELQHMEVAGGHSLAVVSQSLAEHLLNLVSHDSNNCSCKLLWAAVLILHSHMLSLVSFPAYLGFLWMLLLVAYGQRDPNSYYLNKHIENSFTDGFHSIYSYQDFFTWANTTLVKNLYGSYKGTESIASLQLYRLWNTLFYTTPWLAHTYLTKETVSAWDLVWILIIGITVDNNPPPPRLTSSALVFSLSLI